MEFINDSNLQENPYFNPNKKNPLTILIPISFPISIILMINDPNPIKIPIPIPIPISFPIHYLNIRVLGSNYTKNYDSMFSVDHAMSRNCAQIIASAKSLQGIAL